MIKSISILKIELSLRVSIHKEPKTNECSNFQLEFIYSGLFIFKNCMEDWKDSEMREDQKLALYMVRSGSKTKYSI